ncbi:DsrH/TusB family sulfur relay protein [Marinobacter sp. M1N3S26]|uniref:DsrH/TusB family sulfur relay protein n=1 Tax=unclassified Marinobacter TaxID=83889 RepID=UPI00387ADD48
MSNQTENTPTLHILNKTPGHPRFTACFVGMAEGDLLLLTENAVLALVDDNIRLPESTQALAADCEARGVGGGIPLVDYRGMVQLTDRFSRIISW